MYDRCEARAVTDPLDEIEFLARSANRIEVLQALAERSYTRRELGSAVDASQPTIGRVLNDLRARNWITYDGERYSATETGAFVETGITDLQERLATETTLRGIVEWLPTESIDVDLRAFHEATITTPTGTRPNAPIERMLELLDRTEEAVLLSHTFNRQKLSLIHERTATGALTTKGVFAADAIDAISDDEELRSLLRDIVAADAAEIRVTTDSVPAAVEVTDDRTHLLLRDEDGVVRASMDTDDEAARSWALELHERFWASATTVSASDLE